jgi:hypothetical protein
MSRFVMFTLFGLAAAGAARAADEVKTPAVSVAGKWEMTREGRQGTMTQTFTFEQNGEALKGTVSFREREIPLTGTLKGDKVQFSFSAPGRDGGETRTMEYSGTVSGDEMKLEFETPRGKREGTAKRVSDKDKDKKDGAAKPPTT